jgi:hypothetical protein
MRRRDKKKRGRATSESQCLLSTYATHALKLKEEFLLAPPPLPPPPPTCLHADAAARDSDERAPGAHVQLAVDLISKPREGALVATRHAANKHLRRA